MKILSSNIKTLGWILQGFIIEIQPPAKLLFKGNYSQQSYLVLRGI